MGVLPISEQDRTHAALSDAVNLRPLIFIQHRPPTRILRNFPRKRKRKRNDKTGAPYWQLHRIAGEGRISEENFGHSDIMYNTYASTKGVLERIVTMSQDDVVL